MQRPEGAGVLARRGPPFANRQAADRGVLDWDRDGQDWPNREASRFLEVAGMRWHVQIAGEGPAILLLHGTGASTHSWRDLLPELAGRYTVVAPDLPGHAFTGAPPDEGYSLDGMAAATADLVDALGICPTLLIGHSAGAAIALRMVLDRRVDPRGVISLNGALLPFRGLAGQLFSPAARLMARLDFVPRLVARRAADPAAVLRLLRGTGSEIDERGIAIYRRLMKCPAHVAATIAMMSRWDLAPLTRVYRDLDIPVLLVVGEADGTVSPAEADRVARLMPAARVTRLAGLGHLAHEEAPARVAELITEFGQTLRPGGCMT